VGSIATYEILDFLRRLGERYRGSGTLFLLGGSALCVLGNPRRTLDIDYITGSPPDGAAELQMEIESLAAELKLELEAVPLGEFIPLPSDTDTRHRWSVKLSVFSDSRPRPRTDRHRVLRESFSIPHRPQPHAGGRIVPAHLDSIDTRG
jgi:hypothetical protein